MGFVEWANGLSGIGAWPRRIKSSRQPVWAGLSPTLIGFIPFLSNNKKEEEEVQLTPSLIGSFDFSP